jgi:Reverse transcriptase (RNA-dependent DNA polymerase)
MSRHDCSICSINYSQLQDVRKHFKLFFDDPAHKELMAVKGFIKCPSCDEIVTRVGLRVHQKKAFCQQNNNNNQHDFNDENNGPSPTNVDPFHSSLSSTRFNGDISSDYSSDKSDDNNCNAPFKRNRPSNPSSLVGNPPTSRNTRNSLSSTGSPSMPTHIDGSNVITNIRDNVDRSRDTRSISRSSKNATNFNQLPLSSSSPTSSDSHLHDDRPSDNDYNDGLSNDNNHGSNSPINHGMDDNNIGDVERAGDRGPPPVHLPPDDIVPAIDQIEIGQFQHFPVIDNNIIIHGDNIAALWGMQNLDQLDPYCDYLTTLSHGEVGSRFFGSKLAESGPFHYRYVDRIQLAVLHFLKVANNDQLDDRLRELSMIAFMVLPSVLKQIFDVKKRLGSLVTIGNFLNRLQEIILLDRHPRYPVLFLLYVFETDRARLIAPIAMPFENSINKVNARCKELIRKCKITKAKDCLVNFQEQVEYAAADLYTRHPPAPPPTTAELIDRTAILFPPAPEGSRTSLDPEIHAAATAQIPRGKFNLTFDEFESTLRKSSSTTASGLDSWTYLLLKQVLFRETHKALIFDAIRDFTDLAFAGSLPGSYAVSSSRLVYIPKGRGEYRPIAIASALYRLVAKFLLNRFQVPVGNALGGLQLAVGRPDGCSIGTVLTQYLYSKGFYLLAADSPNAFNREEHNSIYAGLQQYCPSLLDFLVWSLGESPELRSGRGELLGHVRTGTRQGDPLSALFFCVSAHHRLLQYQQILVDSDSAHDVIGADKSILYAYCDDQFFAVKPTAARTDVMAVFNQIFDKAAELGVPFNMRKTFILHKSDLPSISPLCVTKGEVLGAMISDNPADFCSAIDSIKEDMEKICSILLKKEFNTVVRYFILAYCVNAMPGYQARIYNPLLVSDRMHRIDNLVDQTLGTILQGFPEMPDYSKQIRSFSHRLGGLGITKYSADLSSYSLIQADALSRRAIAWIGEFHPDLLQDFQDRAPLFDHNRLRTGDTPITASNASRRYFKVQEAAANALISELANDPKTVPQAVSIKANWFRGSGAPFSFGSHGVHIIPQSVFRHVASARLALPVHSNHLNLVCACPQGNNLKNHPCDPTAISHHLCCPLQSNFRIHRHEAILGHLVRYVKRIIPPAVIVSSPEFANGNDIRRADIMITVPEQNPVTIDIGVCCHSTLQKLSEVSDDPNGQNILHDPHRGATAYASRKRALYAPFNVPHFVPFIVTTPGNLGPDAVQFLDSIEGRIPAAPNPDADVERLEAIHSARHDLIVSIVQTCQFYDGLARRNYTNHRVRIGPWPAPVLPDVPDDDLDDDDVDIGDVGAAGVFVNGDGVD